MQIRYSPVRIRPAPLALKHYRIDCYDTYRWPAVRCFPTRETVRTVFRRHPLCRNLYGNLRVAEFSPLKLKAVRQKIIDEAFVDTVEAHVAPQVWAMIERQRFTGLRPGEFTKMWTYDPDTSAKVWVYTSPSHKSEWRGHERYIFIGPRPGAGVFKRRSQVLT